MAIGFCSLLEIGLTHCDHLRSNYASCTRKKQRSPRRRRRSLAPRVLTFVRGSTCAMCTTTLDAQLQFPSRRN
uniref:Secreted protein n=1 Tax=Trichogramma kaykai TaxID=54128 RepID=A0ABD2X8M7_9HYME